MHAGDHAIYPDCRPAFIEAIEHEARVANEGFIADGFQVLAPFLRLSKDDIVRRGAALGVPFDETWSCYLGERAALRPSAARASSGARRSSSPASHDPTTYAAVPV